MDEGDVGGEALVELVRSAVADRSPDLIAAFRRDGVILWLNDAGGELLGYDRDETLGRSIAEFLHPEDAERAIALALAEVDHLRGSHTGAPYRFLCADGTYAILDVSVTVLDELLVAVCRPMRDHDVMDRVLTGLTSGASFEDVVALLPEFDLWRNPTARCVVRCQDDDGRLLVLGSVVPPAAGGEAPAPGSPWARALAERREVVDPDLSALPADLAAWAEREGLAGVRVRAVDDPRGFEPALVTAYVAGDRSPIQAHQYPMATIARMLDLIMRFHQSAGELHHAATHDALTGLLHRGGFFAALPDRLPGTPVTVLAVDLDGFKQVNDRFGHAAGDEVLRLVANRLREAVGPDAVIARLGGDEFVVVVLDRAERIAAEALADRIRGELERPIALADGTVEIGASIGIAVDAGPHHDLDVLLADADAALYRSKPRSRRARR